MKFAVLLGKEIREERNWIIFGVFAFLIIYSLLFTRLNAWEKGSLTLAGFSIATIGLSTFAALKGLQSIKREWDSRTIHLLMSLPVTGYHIIFAKFLAFLFEILLLTSVAFALNYAAFIAESMHIKGIGLQSFIVAYIYVFFLLIVFFSIPFLSYITSKCLYRMRKLAAVVTLVASIYITVKLKTLFVKAFSFMPTLNLVKVTEITEQTVKISGSVSTALLLYLLVISLVYLFIAGLLLNNRVEI